MLTTRSILERPRETIENGNKRNSSGKDLELRAITISGDHHTRFSPGYTRLF